MAFSGEQWLERFFRPTVAEVNRARHDRSAGAVPADALRLLGNRLAAQVEALGDTGVLTDAQESAALAALEEAGIMPEVRSVSHSTSTFTAHATALTAVRAGSAPATARAPAEPPRLRGVLAGPRQLVRLDGRPVTLISAELWSDRFLVDLCADPGRTPLDSPLRSLTWELRDELGTEYVRTGGAAESGDHLDRQRMQWSPAPSANIDQLTLLATDATGAAALNAEIPVPRQAR